MNENFTDDEDEISLTVLHTSNGKREQIDIKLSDTLNDLKKRIVRKSKRSSVQKQIRLFHLGRELKTGGRSLNALGVGRYGTKIPVLLHTVVLDSKDSLGESFIMNKYDCSKNENENEDTDFDDDDEIEVLDIDDEEDEDDDDDDDDEVEVVDVPAAATSKLATRRQEVMIELVDSDDENNIEGHDDIMDGITNHDGRQTSTVTTYHRQSKRRRMT